VTVLSAQTWHGVVCLYDLMQSRQSSRREQALRRIGQVVAGALSAFATSYLAFVLEREYSARREVQVVIASLAGTLAALAIYAAEIFVALEAPLERRLRWLRNASTLGRARSALLGGFRVLRIVIPVLVIVGVIAWIFIELGAILSVLNITWRLVVVSVGVMAVIVLVPGLVVVFGAIGAGRGAEKLLISLGMAEFEQPDEDDSRSDSQL
jgi:hypothetical protein